MIAVKHMPAGGSTVVKADSVAFEAVIALPLIALALVLCLAITPGGLHEANRGPAMRARRSSCRGY